MINNPDKELHGYLEVKLDFSSTGLSFVFNEGLTLAVQKIREELQNQITEAVQKIKAKYPADYTVIKETGEPEEVVFLFSNEGKELWGHVDFLDYVNRDVALLLEELERLSQLSRRPAPDFIDPPPPIGVKHAGIIKERFTSALPVQVITRVDETTHKDREFFRKADAGAVPGDYIDPPLFAKIYNDQITRLIDYIDFLEADRDRIRHAYEDMRVAVSRFNWDMRPQTPAPAYNPFHTLTPPTEEELEDVVTRRVAPSLPVQIITRLDETTHKNREFFQVANPGDGRGDYMDPPLFAEVHNNLTARLLHYIKLLKEDREKLRSLKVYPGFEPVKVQGEWRLKRILDSEE